ncbi:FIST C domain protein [mine drainage metagenome]|uniref:FIST C domain protein n=1 Tax=mine drainage metagenome TaxID=410659 RepID=A0A1J5SE97_9ZZZZ
MKVATSIAFGNQATPELAAQAVSQAMHKADISVANSVLLLLTSEFANQPQAAIKAAAKAANCTQVIGCSASGIFTEDDWALDAPAAAAMVFGDSITLQLPNKDIQQPLFTLCAPNAINSTWLNDGNVRYGGVSGDAIGQGNFSVWKNAKGELSGHVDAFFSGVEMATRASHGLQLLTQPLKIKQVKDFDIFLLDSKSPQYNQSPWAVLQKAWKAYSKSDEPVPLHLIMATYADNTEEINAGQYRQTNIISYDENKGNITLAQPLKVGQFLSWSLRNQTTAEADMLLITHQLVEDLGKKPDFGLLFSCLGRGPYFYDGIDRDLKVITQQLPNMPLLGFYGNGEIAPMHDQNQLLPYSAVLSLFTAK